MKTGVVILARLSSKRLPRKGLLLIEGKTILAFIVERLATVLSKDQIVVATSTNEDDDELGELASTLGVRCFRGSLDNVAERFYMAASSLDLDYGIRINGDNIFVDSDVLRNMIQKTVDGSYDFITNVTGRTFPMGMSVEIVRLSYFKSLLPEISSSPKYREHVTLYLYEHPGDSTFNYINDYLPGAAGIQMAVDTPEDLERTRRIVKEFTLPQWKYNLPEIFRIWTKLKDEERI